MTSSTVLLQMQQTLRKPYQRLSLQARPWVFKKRFPWRARKSPGLSRLIGERDFLPPSRKWTSKVVFQPPLMRGYVSFRGNMFSTLKVHFVKLQKMAQKQGKLFKGKPFSNHKFTQVGSAVSFSKFHYSREWYFLPSQRVAKLGPDKVRLSRRPVRVH